MNELNKQQIFAESYLEKYIERKNDFLHNPNTVFNQIDVDESLEYALLHGNSNKEIIEEGGYAKLTDTLADYAMSKYEVVDHQENTITGFSATLLKTKPSDGNYINFVPEYTLAFRSTDYSQTSDFFRDGKGADLEIYNNGFAYGQISDMEKYYEYLKSGANPILPANTKIN